MLNETDTIHGPLEFQRVVDAYTKGGQINVVTPTKPGFRPGTVLPIINLCILFQGAGFGDYVCYMPALLWLARNCPQLRVQVFVGKEFMQFAQNILWDYNEMWKVCDLDHVNHAITPNSMMRSPGILMNGIKYQQLANGTGGHLVSVGFLYFCNIFPVPEGADLYPIINFSGSDHHIPAGLHFKTYVVFTPGAVSENRTVPGSYWNPIIDHVKKKGLTPVFIGKSQVTKNLRVNFPEGCNYDAGVDLRNKTTILEAAWLMKNAACTIGLDNGMIHLAACTNGSIVAGYNMVDPKDRRPNRKAGKWEEISLSHEELACAGCQSYMKQVTPHTFNRCLYGDNKCIDMLFEDGGRRWIEAIDRIVGH